MKSLKEFPSVLLEAWATFSVFRNLGFDSTEIFLVTQKDEGSDPPIVTIGMTLPERGSEPWVWVTGKTEMTQDEIAAQWESLAAALQTTAEEERKVIYEQSHAVKDAPLLILQLKLHGIPLPFQTN